MKGALDRALRDLDARLGAQATLGWPDDVALSATEPRRPMLEIGVITNTTSLPLDVQELERRLTQQLIDGGHVVVTAGAAREDPSVGGATGAEAGGNDVAGLLLVGTLEEVVLELEAGVHAHEAIVTLTITDMRRRPLVEARGEFAVVGGAR